MSSILQQVAALLASRDGTPDDRALVARARSVATNTSRPGLGMLDRHRLELLAMAARGHAERAMVLSREHLIDFPDDAVIGALIEVLEAAEEPHGEPSPPT